MKPCNNCDKKPDCRVICKAFSDWLDDDSPQGPILENKPIKLNLWCGRKGHTKPPTKPAALTVVPNKAAGGAVKINKPTLVRDKNGKFKKGVKNGKKR